MTGGGASEGKTCPLEHGHHGKVAGKICPPGRTWHHPAVAHEELVDEKSPSPARVPAAPGLIDSARRGRAEPTPAGHRAPPARCVRRPLGVSRPSHGRKGGAAERLDLERGLPL